MSTRLYVGNSAPETTPDDLNSLFGQVPEAGRFRGFGFVEIDPANVEDVIFKLSITELDGRRQWAQRDDAGVSGGSRPGDALQAGEADER